MTQSSPLYTYRMDISYVGTHFSGWQRQPNALSIQEVIENALGKILQQEVIVLGSGRTDAGVHAREQVAHFRLPDPIEPLKLLRSLNGLLSDDIRIYELNLVSNDFHARYSAKGKTYTYRIDNGLIADPFMRPYAIHLQPQLNIDAMKDAALLFEGTHDFKAFANKATQGSAAVDSVRTIHSITFEEKASLLEITFNGKGFLYKMVRNIVGSLIMVGRGKLTKQELKQGFDSFDRTQLPPPAPARGLTLEKVHYD